MPAVVIGSLSSPPELVSAERSFATSICVLGLGIAPGGFIPPERGFGSEPDWKHRSGGASPLAAAKSEMRRSLVRKRGSSGTSQTHAGVNGYANIPPLGKSRERFLETACHARYRYLSLLERPWRMSPSEMKLLCRSREAQA